jgi:hypothetical protein
MSAERRRNPAGPRPGEASSVAACRTHYAPPDGAASAFAANTTEPDTELAGQFHTTTMVRNRPRTLGTWRVTTTSRPTADRVARLLGGHLHQGPTTGCAEVLTTATTVSILLPGPEALHLGWQRSARGSCDGRTQDDGQPCACPAGLAARRAAAKRGDGCRPRVEARFALADDPAAGVFAFASEDWSLVALAGTLRQVLEGSGMPARVRLGLERTLHRLQSGRVLACTRPVIALVGRRT